jgi:hypothetical protein
MAYQREIKCRRPEAKITREIEGIRKGDLALEADSDLGDV